MHGTISRIAGGRALLSLRSTTPTRLYLGQLPLSSVATKTPLGTACMLQRRWRTAAPKEGDGPLLERRADRELPDVASVTFRWSRTLPIFVFLITISSLAIFNYQKSSSPVISSTLYALRVNSKARDLLGDEVFFKHQIPWISGEMNQLQGRINVAFSVKGTKSEAVMRFASYRLSHKGMFETTEWSLEMPDGRRIDLLDGGDPFRGIVGGEVADFDEEAEPASAVTRGFRK